MPPAAPAKLWEKRNEQPTTVNNEPPPLTGAAALAAAPLLAGLWPKAALAQAISEALPQFIVLRQAQKA